MASCVTVTAAKPGHKPDVELMQNAVRNVVECYGLRAFFEEANEEVVVEFRTLHTAKDFSSAFNGQQDAQKGGPSFIALQPVAKGADDDGFLDVLQRHSHANRSTQGTSKPASQGLGGKAAGQAKAIAGRGNASCTLPAKPAVQVPTAPQARNSPKLGTGGGHPSVGLKAVQPHQKKGAAGSAGAEAAKWVASPRASPIVLRAVHEAGANARPSVVMSGAQGAASYAAAASGTGLIKQVKVLFSSFLEAAGAGGKGPLVDNDVHAAPLPARSTGLPVSARSSAVTTTASSSAASARNNIEVATVSSTIEAATASNALVNTTTTSTRVDTTASSAALPTDLPFFATAGKVLSHAGATGTASAAAIADVYVMDEAMFSAATADHHIAEAPAANGNNAATGSAAYNGPAPATATLNSGASGATAQALSTPTKECASSHATGPAQTFAFESSPNAMPFLAYGGDSLFSIELPATPDRPPITVPAVALPGAAGPAAPADVDGEHLLGALAFGQGRPVTIPGACADGWGGGGAAVCPKVFGQSDAGAAAAGVAQYSAEEQQLLFMQDWGQDQEVQPLADGTWQQHSFGVQLGIKQQQQKASMQQRYVHQMDMHDCDWTAASQQLAALHMQSGLGGMAAQQVPLAVHRLQQLRQNEALAKSQALEIQVQLLCEKDVHDRARIQEQHQAAWQLRQEQATLHVQKETWQWEQEQAAQQQRRQRAQQAAQQFLWAQQAAAAQALQMHHSLQKQQLAQLAFCFAATPQLSNQYSSMANPGTIPAIHAGLRAGMGADAGMAYNGVNDFGLLGMGPGMSPMAANIPPHSHYPPPPGRSYGPGAGPGPAAAGRRGRC